MTASQRIIVNTLATYGRTVFSMALGLFSSRWVLHTLGPVDYGLMAVVGSLITFITFLNGVTANSCARFFALSIGKGDAEETKRWFNAALSIHTVLPSVLTLLGWPAGEWCLAHFLNIPPARLATATWVFRLSLISALWGMITTPYQGMFTAKQRIYEMSVWGIVQTLISFGLAYALTLYRGDCWLLYSAGTVGIMVGVGFLQVLRAQKLYVECHIDFSQWWNWSRIRQVTSFSGWQLFGSVGTILRGQGTAVLLNKYFNPAQFAYVNASYSLGNTVSGYTQTLATALQGAFTPEITATEGRGDRSRMLHLSNRASKFGTWLILLIAIPLLLEIDGLLVLWLKTPPELTAVFCRLIIIQFLIERLTFGHMVAVSAVGRIAGYQMMLGGLLILTLPIAWLFLLLGYPAPSVAWAFIITASGLSIGRVLFAKTLVGAMPSDWIKAVLAPCLLVFAVGMALGSLSRAAYGPFSFFRLCVVTAVTTASWGLLGWLAVLDRSEKTYFVVHLTKLAGRLQRAA